MDKVRIVIVDDSPFSIILLRDMLEEAGYEVVGEARSLEEVIEVVADTKPDLVTMDMTIPGTDGLECTREVHKIDPTIKVIVVSSMMDDEIVKEAKKNKVSGYVQKPVDPDELIMSINRVMTTEDMYDFLQKQGFAVFKESLLDGVNKMTKTLLTFKEEYSVNKECVSNGLTVVIGIIGKFAGRMVLDLSTETAEGIAASLLRRPSKSQDEMIAVIAEFANIVSGNACSTLNRKDKAFGLRVAPPSILYGDNVHISAPSFKTDTVIGQTDFGEILMNAGFTRSDDQWM